MTMFGCTLIASIMIGARKESRYARGQNARVRSIAVSRRRDEGEREERRAGGGRVLREASGSLFAVIVISHDDCEITPGRRLDEKNVTRDGAIFGIGIPQRAERLRNGTR